MKSLKTHSLFLITTAAFLLWSKASTAQDLSSATSQISSTLISVMATVKTICLVLAGGTAAWGLVQALGRASSESRDGHNHFVRWFVAAGGFGLAWVALGVIFKI